MIRYPKLSQRAIAVLRSLYQRGASTRPVALNRDERAVAVPLWRRGLVDVWSRHSPDSRPSPQGPYFGLTLNGLRLAIDFLPAPRGISGAEETP